MLLAAGCENQKSADALTPPPIPETFSANLKIVYGESLMTAEFTQKTFEEFELRMLTPEILNPLTLCYKDGVCTVNYDSLKFETDLNRFPQVALGALLTEAISDIRDGINVQATLSDGIWTYKGTGERGIFILTRDADSGDWLELSAEGAQLHITFSDFKK